MEEPEELGEEEIHYNFTYDDYGNCITKSDGINTWEYTYDYENRLLSVTEWSNLNNTSTILILIIGSLMFFLTVIA